MTHVPGSVRELVAVAATLSGVSEADILSRKRDRRCAHARFGVMLVARAKRSSTQIGRVLRRDHSTVLSGVKRARKIAARDAAFATFVAELETAA